MRTLYVKKVGHRKLCQEFGVTFLPSTYEYIQCTKDGKINYDKNLAYTLEELERRGNYKVV